MKGPSISGEDKTPNESNLAVIRSPQTAYFHTTYNLNDDDGARDGWRERKEMSSAHFFRTYSSVRQKNYLQEKHRYITTNFLSSSAKSSELYASS